LGFFDIPTIRQYLTFNFDKKSIGIIINKKCRMQ